MLELTSRDLRRMMVLSIDRGSCQKIVFDVRGKRMFYFKI